MIKKLFNKLFSNKLNQISFKQSFDLTDMPIVTFYQGDKKFNFLLDSGSTDCIIDSAVLDSIEYSPHKSDFCLFGMEGRKREVSACNITLSYKGIDYSFFYLINDMKSAFGHIKQETGVTLHGILGTKFFNEYKYVLDFDEMIAYSKKQ